MNEECWGDGLSASLRDRAGGPTDLSPASGSQPKALIPSATRPIEKQGGQHEVAWELREIARETACPQRQMHLEIAAQIVEEGQFAHPCDFGLIIRIEQLEAELARLRDRDGGSAGDAEGGSTAKQRQPGPKASPNG